MEEIREINLEERKNKIFKRTGLLAGPLDDSYPVIATKVINITVLCSNMLRTALIKYIPTAYGLMVQLKNVFDLEKDEGDSVSFFLDPFTKEELLMSPEINGYSKDWGISTFELLEIILENVPFQRREGDVKLIDLQEFPQFIERGNVETHSVVDITALCRKKPIRALVKYLKFPDEVGLVKINNLWEFFSKNGNYRVFQYGKCEQVLTADSGCQYIISQWGIPVQALINVITENAPEGF